MNLRKIVVSLSILTGTIAPAMLTFANSPLQLRAQSLPTQMIAGIKFPSTGGGMAREASGGGTRAGSMSEACVVENGKSLTVLMPKNNLGTTVTEAPTLYWYAPQTRAQEAEFVLLDEQNQEVYATIIDIPRSTEEPELSEAGIMQISLPQNNGADPLLESGKQYTWFLALVCNQDDRSYDETIEGMIERQELDSQLQASIEQENSLVKKADMYAQEAIWTDALMILADLRDSQPQEWESFLDSVDLGGVAKEPFVN